MQIINNDVKNGEFKKTMVSFLENQRSNIKIYFPYFLDDDEIELMRSYLENIGKTDPSSQLNYLSSSVEKIDQKLKNAEKNEKNYKSLYIKLGFLCGVVIFILII